MGSLTVARTSIVGNRANGAEGGGVSAVNDAELIVQDAEVTGNAGNDKGGGIFFSSVEQRLSLSRLRVANNTADSCGGVAFVAGASFTAEDSVVSSNEATEGPGGGLCIASPPLVEMLSTCVHTETLELKKPFGDIAVVSPGQLLPNSFLNCSWLITPTHAPRGCLTQLEFVEIVPSGALNSLLTLTDIGTVRTPAPSALQPPGGSWGQGGSE